VAYRSEHSVRFLVPAVDFVTGAGSAERDLRRSHRLPGRGVVAAVTGAAVLAWEDSGVRLVSTHVPDTAEQTRSETGFPLLANAVVPVTEAVPAEALHELDTLIDPSGMRRLEVRAERPAALRSLLARSS